MGLNGEKKSSTPKKIEPCGKNGETTKCMTVQARTNDTTTGASIDNRRRTFKLNHRSHSGESSVSRLSQKSSHITDVFPSRPFHACLARSLLVALSDLRTVEDGIVTGEC